RRCRVAQPAEGHEAPPRARERRPDLAVLDVQMPGPDGIEVCAALKADPATAATVVLVLTAEGSAEMRGRAVAAGAERKVGTWRRARAPGAVGRKEQPPRQYGVAPRSGACQLHVSGRAPRRG